MIKTKILVSIFIFLTIATAAVFIFDSGLTGFSVYSPDKIKINLQQDNFAPGENVSFSVDVFDDSNNLLNVPVNVIIEDAGKKIKVEESANSGEDIEIQLDNNAPFGYWKITAISQNTEDSIVFSVAINENVKFSLNGDVVTIENRGNSRYKKTIQIMIGETIGTKNVDLDIGESLNIRLTAPDGLYNIKVTDGKTSLTENSVSLTGNVVGVFAENTQGSGITGVAPDEKENLPSSKGKYVYFFLAVIIGVTVLLAIERNYRRKLEN